MSGVSGTAAMPDKMYFIFVSAACDYKMFIGVAHVPELGRGQLGD